MKNMNVKIFADGADKKSMQEMYDKDFISLEDGVKSYYQYLVN